jgi:plastocyanin
VAPFRGLSLTWALRGAVALALLALVVLALQRSEATTSVPVVAPSIPPPTATPQATQTPQPITSIILRQTLAPFPTATPGPSNQVSVVDFSYMPGVVRISAGQSVFWRNDGTEQHDVTGADWHSGPLDPGYTYRLTFGLAGTYPYRCSIHLDMTGSVIVT